MLGKKPFRRTSAGAKKPRSPVEPQRGRTERGDIVCSCTLSWSFSNPGRGVNCHVTWQKGWALDDPGGEVERRHRLELAIAGPRQWEEDGRGEVPCNPVSRHKEAP